MVRHTKMNANVDAQDAASYLKRPYGRLLVPEEDGSYRAEMLEFPGCFAEGDSPAEAFDSLEASAESWIEAAMEMGKLIPKPLEESEFSGKLVLRLPKSLHRKAAMAAERDGVSLNQFIATSVAEQVGIRTSTPARTRDVIVVQQRICTTDEPWSNRGALPSYGTNLIFNQEFTYAQR